MAQPDKPYIARFVNGVEIKREPGKFQFLGGTSYICECGMISNKIQNRYLHIKSIKHRVAIGELPLGYGLDNYKKHH